MIVFASSPPKTGDNYKQLIYLLLSLFTYLHPKLGSVECRPYHPCDTCLSPMWGTSTVYVFIAHRKHVSDTSSHGQSGYSSRGTNGVKCPFLWLGVQFLDRPLPRSRTTVLTTVAVGRGRRDWCPWLEIRPSVLLGVPLTFLRDGRPQIFGYNKCSVRRRDPLGTSRERWTPGGDWPPLGTLSTLKEPTPHRFSSPPKE